jgi:polyisoprenyl-teichoic acid--peptidoglycan teichoic acid transferase
MAKLSIRPLFVQLLLFWALALGLAVGLFVSVRAFTVCWRLTSLPGIPATSCEGEPVYPLETPVIGREQDPPRPTSTPEPPIPEEEEYPTWDGGSRINILFVGLRGADHAEGGCPYCTDTLILLTVDPVTKTAGMLSIPRDMWVNIPGFGYSRINTAWTLGRGSRLPGGGPSLAMKTVSHFIGVPVDYYVQVDFDTFVDIIDLIGGVDVYNDETLLLDPMAHGRELKKVKLTCCGMRHLNGAVALAYARCRHLEQGCLDGDIGRARRQQKVIFAIRDKVLSPENFPDLLAQAPELYGSFSSGIRTNMPLDDAIKLAVMIREIPREKIKNAVIDHSMITLDSVILGGQKASIIRPIPDEIRVLRDQIFTPGGPLSPLAEGDPLSLMLIDKPRVRVLNGTTTPGLDRQTGEYLIRQGILVTEFGETKPPSRTTIVLYSPKLYALQFFIDLFGVTRSSQILIDPDPTQTVDVEIRLGADWVGKVPFGNER